MRRRAASRLLPRHLPRSRVAAVTAIALAAVAIFAGLTHGHRRPTPPLPRVASSALGAKSQLQAGMAELLRSYDPKTGLIGKFWWQAAVALSTVETYAQATKDTRYDAVIARAFAAHSRSKFENASDDDTAWWALAWLQAYDLTHVASYLWMAETEADYIHQAWDGACGGGIWWHRSPRGYKNAISNELFLELTAWLHNRIPGDTKYLRWAQAEWSWLNRSGMINNNDLVNDGLDDACANNAGITWSYNQGVILAGLAQLYQATGNTSLLNRAEHMARAAISQLTPGGVLTEPCERSACTAMLSHNTLAFKGIFVRDLKVLAVTARTTEFNAFFVRQARSIEARDTTRDRRHGMSWVGPVTTVDSATEASALDALIASLDLPSTARGARAAA